jgi:hypothetical protein
MENQLDYDIGQEILSRLDELIRILELRRQAEYEEKLISPDQNRY